MSKLKNKCHIIVIGYGPELKTLEKKCFNSIIRNTVYPYLFTYIDNFKSGLSLTEAWNELIASSPCKYIALINNDVEVTPYWLKKLIEVLEKNPKIGFVGPSGKCHSPQKAIQSEEEAAKYKGQVELLKDPISGFATVFRKETWEKLGGMDERFPLYGSESAFMKKASVELSLKFAWRKDVFIYHEGESSTKAYNLNTEKERQIAKDLYWKEYGGLSGKK